MTIRIEIEPEAEAQFEALATWWQQNRKDARIQLADELVRLRTLLISNPEIGVQYRRRGITNIRTLRLHKTPYKLYYHYAPGTDLVTLLSFWSCMHKKGPPLPLLKKI